ncbi:DUF1049 domain-containing protein [Gordonia sp. X0973]|uniref:DUF1049 domain-containing protein n=1 Tax=Gordonia sp. X0973 TaxID=2742602 RepID=UPI000F528E8F|nr:DUF1049 domain-containing protein [Gordonia sp. X0973]QKT07292.1 DUF1049 domain-containing protein [Gordonia sp. X0973]
MTNDATNSSFSGSVLGLLKRHWFPIIVAVIAIVFISLNRIETRINFLPFGWLSFNTHVWLALSVAAILGLLVGLFLRRK